MAKKASTSNMAAMLSQFLVHKTGHKLKCSNHPYTIFLYVSTQKGYISSFWDFAFRTLKNLHKY